MIYSIAVLKRLDQNRVYYLTRRDNFASVSLFKRKMVREFITMAMREAVKSTDEDHFTSFENLEYDYRYRLHLYRRGDRYATMVVEGEHRDRICRKMLLEVFDEFEQRYGGVEQSIDRDLSLKLPPLKKLVQMSPKEYDKITKIADDLDELKETMLDSIDRVIERGVRIDTLVEKSADLSEQSRLFYRATKRFTRCCYWF